MLMIWSSLERNRSPEPLACIFFGRIEHLPDADSEFTKSAVWDSPKCMPKSQAFVAQTPDSGENSYFRSSENSAGSMPCAFFTTDRKGAKARRCTSHHPSGRGPWSGDNANMDSSFRWNDGSLRAFAPSREIIGR